MDKCDIDCSKGSYECKTEDGIITKWANFISSASGLMHVDYACIDLTICSSFDGDKFVSCQICTEYDNFYPFIIRRQAGSQDQE